MIFDFHSMEKTVIEYKTSRDEKETADEKLFVKQLESILQKAPSSSSSSSSLVSQEVLEIRQVFNIMNLLLSYKIWLNAEVRTSTGKFLRFFEKLVNDLGWAKFLFDSRKTIFPDEKALLSALYNKLSKNIDQYGLVLNEVLKNSREDKRRPDVSLLTSLKTRHISLSEKIKKFKNNLGDTAIFYGLVFKLQEIESEIESVRCNKMLLLPRDILQNHVQKFFKEEDSISFFRTSHQVRSLFLSPKYAAKELLACLEVPYKSNIKLGEFYFRHPIMQGQHIALFRVSAKMPWQKENYLLSALEYAVLIGAPQLVKAIFKIIPFSLYEEACVQLEKALGNKDLLMPAYKEVQEKASLLIPTAQRRRFSNHYDVYVVDEYLSLSFAKASNALPLHAFWALDAFRWHSCFSYSIEHFLSKDATLLNRTFLAKREYANKKLEKMGVLGGAMFYVREKCYLLADLYALSDTLQDVCEKFPIEINKIINEARLQASSPKSLSR